MRNMISKENRVEKRVGIFISIRIKTLIKKIPFNFFLLYKSKEIS